MNYVESGQLVKSRSEISSDVRKLLQGFASARTKRRPFFNVSPGITDVDTNPRF